MAYVLDKNNKNFKLTYFSCDIEGFDIKPQSYNPKSPIKPKKIVLTDPVIIEDYVKQRINKKLDKLFNDMFYILNSEDATDGDTAIVLGEIDRLKGIIINKYKNFLLEEEYKDLIKRIFFAEQEFRKSYNERISFKNMMNMYYSGQEYLEQQRGGR